MAALAIASLSVGLASAQLIINDFDSDVESWRFDFGGGGTAVHDPTEGSPGNAAGALLLTFDFPGGGIAFTGDVFGTETDLTAIGPVLSYDVRVDIPNSSQDAFGTYGFAQFVSRETDGYTWGNQSGFNLDGNGGEWQTITLDTTSPANGGLALELTRAFSFQIFGGGDQDIQGPVNVWLDNIRVDAATVPEPGSLSLLGLSLVGFCARRKRPAKL